MTRTHLMLLVLALSGCASDADTICDKLDECNLLRTSTKECAENFETAYKDSEREACAKCIDAASCAGITRNECRSACPGLGDK